MQLLRFVQRKWHQRQGRVLMLIALSLFILLAWSTTTKGDSEQPSSSLQDIHPSLQTKFTPALATKKSLRSRTALADSSAPHATYLDHTGQLYGMITNSSRVFQPRGKFALRKEDLVLAVPSDLKHRLLVESSKAWRKDMRTYIAVNTSLLPLPRPISPSDTEIWRSYPDDVEAMMKVDSQTWEPRMALTPFFAHEAFEGGYEWMLYGHDDTLFFVEGILDLLQDFDPALPYIITDHFWWTDDPFETATDFFQPNEFAPHCLPCHWTPDYEQKAVGDGKKYQPFTPYTGCPCTVEHICRHDTRKLYKEACDGPLDHLPFRMNSGAGALISRGMMEKLPLAFMEKCIFDIKQARGADDLFSRCLQKAGYAFTSPGYSFYHWEAKSFDPGPQHSHLLEQTFHAASSGAADGIPLDIISHVLTSHTKAEGQGIEQAADTMSRLQRAYEGWRQALLATQAPLTI